MNRPQLGFVFSLNSDLSDAGDGAYSQRDETECGCSVVVYHRDGSYRARPDKVILCEHHTALKATGWDSWNYSGRIARLNWNAMPPAVPEATYERFLVESAELPYNKIHRIDAAEIYKGFGNNKKPMADLGVQKIKGMYYICGNRLQKFIDLNLNLVYCFNFRGYKEKLVDGLLVITE
jgi:hypothetical protein